MSSEPIDLHATAQLLPARQLDFLIGGGEMGARMRAFDWSSTPLGPPARWPQSLKTLVRVMLDSRYAMWMLWGPDLTFFCNDAYLPTVGMKRDWVLGARSDKVWAEIWGDIGPRIEQVLERGEATWDEGLQLFLERRGFPEETYHTFSYSPVYDDLNSIAGMLCVVTEVTERVIGERRLQLLRDLAARTVGVETTLEGCGRLCEVLRQYPLDVPFAVLYLHDEKGSEARRMAATHELPPELAPLCHSLSEPPPLIAAALREEQPQLVESLPYLGIQVPAAPWPDIVQQAMVLPLKSSGQEHLAGFMIVGLSPRRPYDEDYRSFMQLIAGQVASAVGDAQAHESDRRRAEALAELDRAKTTFFSNVSHEFRTPLTLMIGPTEQALASPEQALKGEDLERVHRSELRLLKLVNSLLEFSRIEAGRMQARYEPTELAALTRDLASTFRSAVERAGLQLQVDCPTLGEPVYVDREMWEKIVLNLLSNAFKYTLQGQIGVRLQRDGASALLEVYDTGTGIPEHEIPHLFERFHRVEGAQGRTHEGSGIGLALVHELVKLHGGRVEASSRLGEGTVFRVHLPLGDSHLPAAQVHQDSLQPQPHSTSLAFVREAERWLPEPKRPAPPITDQPTAVADQRFADTFGARVLVADDNADMRHYVRDLLAGNYIVEVVPDGERGLAAARAQRPDLIISDVMMPRLDGFGLLQHLRADNDLREVPVILLSARAGEESRIEGLDAGADDYLVKPFSARELVARVGAIIERRRAQTRFRLRTAQFETLLKEAPLGVYLIDADFRIRDVNPTALQAFGDLPQLVGRDFDEVIHRLWPRSYADELVRQFRHTLATGEPCYVAERIEQRLDSGVTEYYEWQISRIPLPEGRHGVVCYFRDISASVLTRLELERTDRQKNEFLAMLAHELRNPLAPIRNAGELLARALPADPRLQSATDILQRQVGHLTRLVDDLLDVSRITQGRIDLKFQRVQLAEVIAQAVETVEPLLRERRHRISVKKGQPLSVSGDPARLVQCVVNILNNSAKYTDPGGDIRIELGEQDGDALITVTDNGFGIPQELLPRVFELFVQSDRTLDRSHGGLGIGLSVVKRLTEMHGGSASVASAGPGGGTVVQLRVPLLRGAEESVVASAPVNNGALRILVVDDNADAALTLGMLLELEGHATETALSSHQALELVGTFRPEIVLLDIGLPDIDGYEVCRRIRARQENRDIGIVALTGYGRSEDRERSHAAGFDDHLLKPVELEALQRSLQTLRQRRVSH